MSTTVTEAPKGEIIDPAADPARAAAISARVMAGEDPIEPDAGATPPLIEEPPDDVVTLPGGFVDRKGVLHRTLRVRELTGEDEEELARPSARRSTAHLIDALVSRCVTHVGHLEVGKELPVADLGKLLVGDRDFAALAVRRVTYGNELEIPLGCPVCQNEFVVGYDLIVDVPVKELPGDRSKVQRECALPAGGSKDNRRPKGKALVRLVDGDAQLAVLNADTRQDMSDKEMNTLILRECVDVYRDAPVYSVDEVRAWPALDRRTIIKFLQDNVCGPRYEEVSQDCPKCRNSFPLVISPEILFQ